jgi:TRAP-type C4-dicarboxylate transport system permease small subunit
MKKIYAWFCKIEEIVCGTGFLLLVLLVFLSAVLRALRLSVSWNIDLAMLLLAWTAFLGADIAWRFGQITGVDLVTRTLPIRIQRIIELIVYLIILCTLIVIFVFGAKLAWSERVSRFQSMPIPYGLVTMSLIVASFSMVFTTLQKIKRAVLDFNKPHSAEPAPEETIK